MPNPTMSALLRAAKSSSSKHVSTTKRNMGGTGLGRGRMYSMVVELGWSSRGRLTGEISLY